jgi:hypothetical protein
VDVALPVNAAIALNVASDSSVAYAEATQDVTIDQAIKPVARLGS